jgi:hypothetical protein
MAPLYNPFGTLSSQSTRAAEQRRRQLLRLQPWQQSPQASAPAESLAAEEPVPDAEPRLETDSHAESQPIPEARREEETEEESPREEASSLQEEPEPEEPEPEEWSDEDSEPSPAPKPLTLAYPALQGLAGLVVSTLAPHTEADPAAILLQFLAAFGNLIGPAPHSLVGSARHGLNLFVVLVGESSKARKGTSWRQISSLFAEVDSHWASHRVSTTRPTPNGIIQTLRDQQPATDRRLFLLSEEFASVLHGLGQRNSQLSTLLRSAWDGGDLCAQGGNPPQATGPHISMVGHITQSELAQHLGRAESHNGFANRCLWISVRRSKSLPEGGSVPPDELSALARELHPILDWLHSQTEIVFRRSEDAREQWSECYAELSKGRPDMYGAATSRAEAQVLRLSALYAALDCSFIIEPCHLHAALAVWDYCLASARLFFDASPVDPTARRISQALGASPQGLTRTQLRGLFHGHVSSECIDLALGQLSSLGLVNHHTASGSGRSATLWAALGDTKESTGGA